MSTAATIALSLAVAYVLALLALSGIPWRDILGLDGIPLGAAPTWHGRLRESVTVWHLALPALLVLACVVSAAVWAGRRAGAIAPYRKYGYAPKAPVVRA